MKERGGTVVGIQPHRARAQGLCAHRRVRRRDHQLPHWRSTATASTARFPERLTLQFEKVQDMRYGENPHQSAAFYRDAIPVEGGIAGYAQLPGKELSYNNIADADAAWECVKTFDAPACVIVKHANPCGAAIGASRARRLRARLRHRSDLRVRRHHRIQPRARRRRRPRRWRASSSKS